MVTIRVARITRLHAIVSAIKTERPACRILRGDSCSNHTRSSCPYVQFPTVRVSNTLSSVRILLANVFFWTVHGNGIEKSK